MNKLTPLSLSLSLSLPSEFVEGTARIIEARLHREQSEGRIIHYERHGDTGFAVIPREAFTSDSSKVNYQIKMHVLCASFIWTIMSRYTVCMCMYFCGSE